MEMPNHLTKINLNIIEEPKVNYISSLLDKNIQILLTNLQEQYKDYFAWDYHKMPILDRKLVEH